VVGGGWWVIGTESFAAYLIGDGSFSAAPRIGLMKAVIRSYRDLTVWQRAVDLFIAVTDLVRALSWPDRLVFETQTRRAARSVASNISEGHQRRDLGDYLRHVSYARASLGEVETDLVLIQKTTHGLNAKIDACSAIADEVGRKLTNLGVSLRRRRDK